MARDAERHSIGTRNWPLLVSTLHSHFYVEFEVRSAKEELLTRRQGNKETVCDFIT